MDALEVAEDIALPDTRVALCGDWHGNIGCVRTLAKAIPHLAPDIRTIMQLGDWSMDPAADALLIEAGIERVYVTLGNHEIYSEITPLLNAHPGHAVRVSDITWILPRPGRLTIGGRSVLSLGGATSVDKAWRRDGISWWPHEDITDEQVHTAIAGGDADLMLTHEPRPHSRARSSGGPAHQPNELSRRRSRRFSALPQTRREGLGSRPSRSPRAWSYARARRRSDRRRPARGEPGVRRAAGQYRIPRHVHPHHADPQSSRDPRRGRTMTGPWAAIIGPCYTRTSLACELRRTDQEVADAADTLDLLELESVERTVLFPAFQVWNGRVVDGLGAVLQVLSTGTASRWTWAQWLNTAVDDKSGAPSRTATEQLRARHLDEVLRDARHIAWSSSL